MTGIETWPPGCCLRFIQGEQFGQRDRVMIVEPLQPGGVMDISVEMISPAITGIYQGQWRMQTTTGMYFGGRYIFFWSSGNSAFKAF